MKSAKHTIVAGEGIGSCRIGASKQTAIDLFGQPAKPSPDMPGYLEFPSAGVDVDCDANDRIKIIICYFRSETHQPFRGTTDLGIGRDSSVADIIARYGKPSDESMGDVSYDALGITFAFEDEALTDIRVSQPHVDTWPAEWPKRRITDDFAWIAFSDEDGSWLQPVQHAQASFLEFARVAELERFRVVPTFETIAIKAFFEAVSGNPMFGEHIYLVDVSTNGKTITAKLEASAMRRSDLKEGQEVTFPIEKLSDWFLVRNGKGTGGFCIPNVWAQLSEEEQAQFGQSPPFSWFSHRGSKTAEDELIALPQCSKCKRRNLMMEPKPKDACAICRNGGWRCDCPKCGAPLIRFDKLPKLCRRCLGK